MIIELLISKYLYNMLTFLKYDSISQSTKRKYVKIRARQGFSVLDLALFIFNLSPFQHRELMHTEGREGEADLVLCLTKGDTFSLGHKDYLLDLFTEP